MTVAQVPRKSGATPASSQNIPATRFDRTDLVYVALTAVVLALVLLGNAIRHGLPLGYAGLYSLMSELLAAHHWIPPVRVPYYGPGGMPFAYPPLGLYFMALVTHGLHINSFTYLRFAPPIFICASTPAVYLLCRRVLGSRTMAFVAAAFTLTSPSFLLDDAFADGAVRGLAWTLMVSGLVLALAGLRDERGVPALGAGVLLGLTIMTHLENAVFFVLTLGVFSLLGVSPRSRACLRSAVVVGVGVVVSSPWWASDIHRYGLIAFLHALGSHGRLASSSPAWDVRLLLVTILFRLLPAALSSLPQYLLGIVGLIRLLQLRRALVPVWTLANALLIPEGQRFAALMMGIAAAFLLGDVAWAALGRRWSRGINRYALVFGASALGLYSLWRLATWVWSEPVTLRADDRRAAAWILEHATGSRNFLAPSADQSRVEWLPYLIHGSPILGAWGSEWKGDYNRQVSLFTRQSDCLRRQSLECLDRTIAAAGIRPSYLVLTQRHHLLRLETRLRSAATWALVYARGDDEVWWNQEPGPDQEPTAAVRSSSQSRL